MQPAIARNASNLFITGFAKRIAKVTAKVASRVDDPVGSLFGQVRRVLSYEAFFCRQ